MLCSLIDIKVVHDVASERTLWKHTLHSMTDNLVNTALASAKLGWSVEALSAWIASITCVDLVGLLLASEICLAGVDDDYVVSDVLILLLKNVFLLLSSRFSYSACPIYNIRLEGYENRLNVDSLTVALGQKYNY